MAEYKKNHYIPKVVLKNWVTKGPSYEGIFVYEIETKKNMFSAAKGSSGFSFAIANDLYVPVLKGKRIVDAEKWLSGLEDALGAILPIVISGNDIKYEKQMVAVKFLMGLLSLQYRSEYVLSKFREAVEKDAEVQTFLNVHSNRTVDQVIVENIVNSVEETMKSITPTKMRIL